MCDVEAIRSRVYLTISFLKASSERGQRTMDAAFVAPVTIGHTVNVKVHRVNRLQMVGSGSRITAIDS